MIHSVAIAWDQLFGAFANMEQDRVYFLDRFTGEIFSVGSDLGDSFREQMRQQQERFLEIPLLDPDAERRILAGFLKEQDDKEFCRLFTHALSGKPPYANPADLLSFFPEQAERLAELRDSYVSNRVMIWLEENNLFSMSEHMHTVN